MNGLLVNSYHASYDHEVRKENDEQKKSPKRTHYHTWPRKRKSSTKRKISQIINQIKIERAISEIDLKISPPNRIHEFWNYEVSASCGENNYTKIINNQKRNHYLNQYDEKLKKRNNEYVQDEGCDAVKISKSDHSMDHSGLQNGSSVFVDHNTRSTPSNEFIFNENKLGIIRLLKK